MNISNAFISTPWILQLPASSLMRCVTSGEAARDESASEGSRRGAWHTQHPTVPQQEEETKFALTWLMMKYFRRTWC